MKKQWQLPRRTFLKGLGTAMALPLLEAMVPPIKALAAAEAVHPRRLAFLYVPNGANMSNWTPKEVGTDYQLPYILEPLQSLRGDLQVISGLAHDKARAHGDGAGDHARASATFLTGAQARKTSAVNIRAGVSVDQVAAEKVGKATRLSSLELSCDDDVRQAGSCDSGYSCAYQYNLSWRTESTPMPPEVDPRQVFNRLFGNDNPVETAESRARRQRYHKSLLDFVSSDAKRLQSNLGYTDRQKVDEYLTAVREMERRIEQAETFAAAIPDMAAPTDQPRNYQEKVRIMLDLLALSFQTDSTRISTLILSHDGNNRPYNFIGVNDGHHDLSHHQGDTKKKEKIARINRFHLEQFAYFLQKLKGMKEGEGSVLDQCMIVYGSGISDGNNHDHHDLPVILAGKGGGVLKAGQHIRFPKNTPMCNLYMTLLHQMGLTPERFGDSTGPLQGVA